ncbi:hypothetical protein [Scytonema sp. PCC 10023]|uniref:hypothetical protein n=1 Tax=Scytonema sp. PCC 10023 TaxID=1680591 RepID=UPI0039C5FA8E
MVDDLAGKINTLAKQAAQRQAVQQVAESPPTPKKKDKKYLKSFTTPGMAQAQLMARVGGVQNDSESLTAIIDGLFERLNSGSEQELELILHGQIASLNVLACHFMKKALAAYDSTQVLDALPQIPGELAALSLKCQVEMRRCLELLHDMKNPKKPTQFIKNYVNRQLNQLQVEQEELRDQLEATKYATMDSRSQTEAIASDSALETVEECHGTNE